MIRGRQGVGGSSLPHKHLTTPKLTIGGRQGVLLRHLLVLQGILVKFPNGLAKFHLCLFLANICTSQQNKQKMMCTAKAYPHQTPSKLTTVAGAHELRNDHYFCNDSGVLPVNNDNFAGNWTSTTMNLTKTPKRIRNSTEVEEVNIKSETSEGSDFLQRRRRLNTEKGPSG